MFDDNILLSLLVCLLYNSGFQYLQYICVFVFIVPTILTLEIPLSFATISIHRFCSVVYYHKNFFKTKKWIFICILGQWIFGILSILPILSGIQLVRVFLCKNYDIVFYFYIQYCGTPQWVNIYKLIFIVIVPSIIFLVINILIYGNVRSSSRRVQSTSMPIPENNSNNARPLQISRRDVHLLRHMVVMLCIFVGGWTPLYVLFAIQNQFLINPIVNACFTIWCQLALLCDIIDLYLYNHEIRNYLKTTFLRCF